MTTDIRRNLDTLRNALTAVIPVMAAQVLEDGRVTEAGTDISDLGVQRLLAFIYIRDHMLGEQNIAESLSKK